MGIWILSAIGVHAIIYIGEFLIYQIRQITKLKTFPKFPAIIVLLVLETRGQILIPAKFSRDIIQFIV